jgi:hypothetical protein
MTIVVCKPVVVVKVEAGRPAEVVAVDVLADVLADVVAGTVGGVVVDQPSEKLVANEMSTFTVKMTQEKTKEVMRRSIYLIT